MIHLLKVEGKRVLNPETNKDVGPEGVKMKELSTFWFRRLKDGSMIHASEAKSEVKAEAKAEAKADVSSKDKKQKTDKE